MSEMKGFVFFIVVVAYLCIGRVVASFFEDEKGQISDWGGAAGLCWPATVIIAIVVAVVVGIGYALYYAAIGWYKMARLSLTLWGNLSPTTKVAAFYLWPISVTAYAVKVIGLTMKKAAEYVWQLPQQL